MNDKYEVDEVFIDTLKTFNIAHSLNIIEQVKKEVDELPKKSINTQFLGGVVKCENPVYFEIEFLNEPGYVPIFIAVVLISSDEYLDYINENKAF
tara:strand:+ start:2867 stop:3151 length:285 start_codon:yes stop_codon:yes gene_type:complete